MYLSYCDLRTVVDPSKGNFAKKNEASKYFIKLWKLCATLVEWSFKVISEIIFLYDNTADIKFGSVERRVFLEVHFKCDPFFKWILHIGWVNVVTQPEYSAFFNYFFDKWHSKNCFITILNPVSIWGMKLTLLVNWIQIGWGTDLVIALNKNWIM